MRPEDAGAHGVIHRQPVIGIVVRIHHQMPGPLEEPVTIARQVAKLERLAGGFIFRRHRLDRLKGRLIGHPAVGKIHDDHLGIVRDVEELEGQGGTGQIY